MCFMQNFKWLGDSSENLSGDNFMEKQSQWYQLGEQEGRLLCHFSGRTAVDFPWHAPHRHFEDLSTEKGNPHSDRSPTCFSQQLQLHLSSSAKWGAQNMCQCQLCLLWGPLGILGLSLSTAQHPFSSASSSSSIQWEQNLAWPLWSLAKRRLKTPKSTAQIRKIPFVSELPLKGQVGRKAHLFERVSESTVSHTRSLKIHLLRGRWGCDCSSHTSGPSAFSSYQCPRERGKT